MNEYAQNPMFWEKDEPRVMGDLTHRPAAIHVAKLLMNTRHWGHSFRGHHVLEVGCGTGYFARMLAKEGALVTAIDEEVSVLELACAEEEKRPLGIKYLHGKVESMPIGQPLTDQSLGFTLAFCVGVLIHHDARTCVAIMQSAYNTLAMGGWLIVSVTHPNMYLPGSPSRNNKPNWVKHTPLDVDNEHEEKHHRFHEEYLDKEGKIFSSTVWHHPLDFYLSNWIKDDIRFGGNGKVKLARHLGANEIMIEKEHLITPLWGDQYGYPGYLQFAIQKFAPSRKFL